MKTKEPIHLRKTLITTLCWSVLLFCTRADDWPQWQGVDRNSISKETGLLKEWPKEGPPLAWKTPELGGGESAPSIAAGRIFGMSNRGEDEVVWALSEKDGKELWVTRLGPAHKQQASQSKEGPGCTPTVDGELLFVEGLAGTVACLQVTDGKILWQRSLTSDFGGRVPMWSYRESPLVDGNKVIVTPGAEDAMIVALDKTTGKTIWQSKMPAASGGDAPNGPAPGANAPAGAGRAATTVTGTKEPALFTSEHWGMSAFSYKVPNGNYLAKLYFAETYEGISGPGQRVFSFNVHGREFKDFDVWAKAGERNRAYTESVPVAVTNGEFRITFARQVENPAIKAIEIIPQGEAAAGAAAPAAVRINAGASAPFTDSTGQVWLADTGFEGGMSNPGMAGLPSGPGGRDGGARSGGGRGGFGGFGGSGVAYSSPIAIDFEGQRQYVQFTAKALIGVAASDGKFLWRYDAPANRMGLNCSTPLYDDGMVFAASAYGAGGGLVKLTKGADGEVKAEEIYATRKMQNHHGGMVLVDGCLYGANGGNEGGYLICMDFKTGNVLWDGRDDAERRTPKGSIALADGRLYYRTEKGAMLLIEPNAKEYIERGRFEQPDRTRLPAWAHPVIANGKLYLRDQDVLFCYDVKAK
ncbi:MAG TPA: PQQ-binding-like beta-propeller repeat protein [Clostridia bacterium]|nr:PQQ-binding-like beta-propeller repeat protein [Clostridia bacterium]